MLRQAAVNPDCVDGDEALVARARAHDVSAFAQLMKRHNERVYRVVRSVLRNRTEIEDVMQGAYLAAFVHLDQFEGAALWSTWVCRIALNKALTRLKQQSRFVPLNTDDESEQLSVEAKRPGAADPESAVAARQWGLVVERAMDRLPVLYRTVLILRCVQGMSTAETATVLGVAEDVVKTRLRRGRLLLRMALGKADRQDLGDSYRFGGERCDRVVAHVVHLFTYIRYTSYSSMKALG